MPKYYVSWTQEITEFAEIEADSEEHAIYIAKTARNLDVDSEASKPQKNFKAVIDE